MLHDEVVRLRRYRADDLDAMFRLDVVCFAEAFRFSRSDMQRFAEARRAVVVIAEAGGEIVGFCVVHLESGVPRSLRQQRAMKTKRGAGYVVTLDVAPEWRRRGVAGKLMEQAQMESRETGCSAMVLHVFRGNEGAIRFYERAGYERVGEEVGFYGAAGDALVYRKMLQGQIACGSDVL